MSLEWPVGQWTPTSGSFRPTVVSLNSTSPYTGGIKAAVLAQIWVASFSVTVPELDDAHDLQGFLDALDGPSNPVMMFDWWRPMPRGLRGATASFTDGTLFTDGTGFDDGWAPELLAGYARGARAVTMSGLPSSRACFRRGDLIGMGGYVHEVKAGVTSNASGEAMVQFQPGLRVGVATGDAVTLHRPRLPMRMVTDANAAVTRAGSKGQAVDLTFVEDLP